MINFFLSLLHQKNVSVYIQFKAFLTLSNQHEQKKSVGNRRLHLDKSIAFIKIRLLVLNEYWVDLKSYTQMCVYIYAKLNCLTWLFENTRKRYNWVKVTFKEKFIYENFKIKKSLWLLNVPRAHSPPEIKIYDFFFTQIFFLFFVSFD